VEVIFNLKKGYKNMSKNKLPKLQKVNPNKLKKKKILLLSDDLRMHSGIATQSKEFVIGTAHKYDWVQIAGAINHPEQGKIIDMSQAFKNDFGISDAYCKIYPVSGYGDPNLLRDIIRIEKPDAILHFTDPRFWVWLYNMEHEIRQNIPIMYYNIWDDLPDPHWNRNFYRSSDLLMAISKQTYGINKRLLPEYEDWQVKYVPHGISDRRFFKIDKGDTKFREFEQKYGLDKYKFKILYLNRNIRRKSPGDVALAYKHMMDKLTPEQRKDCVFVWHAAPSDENGTDMKAVCKNLLPDYPVIFTFDKGGPMNDEEMNYLYNSVDVYINLASNEGFGLGSCEALTVGKPIVVNVTGGLQDQCGFVEEAPGGGAWRQLNEDDYVELESNHRGKYRNHGKWVKPVFPSNISLAGSPQTPYIFDDRCQYEDAGEALYEWYEVGHEEREKCGELGRQFVLGDGKMTAKHMSDSFIENIETTFKNWKPREKYTLEVV
jgi:glycosyltransferase involved in cell wall biosynthesis